MVPKKPSQMERDILTALGDGEPRTAREIWKRIDCWSVIAVKQTCARMAKAGLIARGTRVYHAGSISIFRKLDGGLGQNGKSRPESDAGVAVQPEATT